MKFITSGAGLRMTSIKLITGICAIKKMLKINDAQTSALKRLLPKRTQARRKRTLLITDILITGAKTACL
jgi:hypothetical protein